MTDGILLLNRASESASQSSSAFEEHLELFRASVLDQAL